MDFSIPESALFVFQILKGRIHRMFKMKMRLGKKVYIDEDDVEHVVVLGSYLRITDSCDNREYSLIVSGVVIIIKHGWARCRF